MARDYGDPNPSDIGDVKPSVPTEDFSETNVRRIGTPDPRVTPQNTDFDSGYKPDEQYQATRHVWAGTILELLPNNYYNVILQNGKEVNARDLYYIPGYSYVEAQSVTIIAGQRYDDFQIIGQKFPSTPSIEYVSLTEILIVGDKAKGKVMLSLGGAGWQKTGDEVTVYDKFFQNYGLIDEVLPFTYNVNTQTATLVGSQGLMRLGVATETIVKDTAGDIQVYDRFGVVTDAIITASLTWMHNNLNITSGKQVLIRWFYEHDDWIIIGREC